MGVDALSVHGGIMLTAWGFLLPIGVLSSRFMRHRDPFWFLLHRTVNGITVFLTIVGVIVAFTYFGNVFVKHGPEDAGYRHGALGMSVMVLCLLNVLGGLLRPGAESSRRGMWSILHKLLGYLTTICAYANLYLGAQLAGGNPYMGVWIFSLVFAVLVALVMMGDKYKNGSKDGGGERPDYEPKPNPRPPKAPSIV